MWRVAVLVSALSVVPSLAVAQQPCTTDSRQVIEQVYRQVLERSADAGASVWIDRLNNRTTVREIVRGIAKSPEHLQRFGNQARESMVVDIYRHLLNRGPDAEGQRNAVNLVSRRGVQPLIDQIMDSQEYRQQSGDWTVPGSSVRSCANGEQPAQQSSIAPGNANGNGMRFRRMDTNNDGVIARTEWRGNPRTFDTYDWNNDGRLSGEEVSVIAQRRGNRNGQDDEVASDDRFDYLDINGNGYIDRNEWDGGQNAFDRLDSNDDRRLTRGEFNIANNGGSSNNFAAIDMNRDGRIRLDEWPWSHTSFDRQDANRDGVISRDEYRGAPQTYSSK